MKTQISNLDKAVAAVMNRESGVRKSQAISQWAEMFEVTEENLKIAVEIAISLEMNIPKVGKNVPEKIAIGDLDPDCINEALMVG